ncbi:MAG: glutathione S-transferase family protein [Rhodospirillaceae bacterium]
MGDLHLIIGNKAYSSWSLRPWIAMKANGLAFRETVIGLQQPDTTAQITKFSGAAKVPVLIHGAVAVWESLAILDYLADTFPDKSWWPKDPPARAQARAVAAEMHAGFSNLRNHMTMNIRTSVPHKSRPEGVSADIARIDALWKECRGRFAGETGPYLFGDFSNADAMYAPVVTRFKTYGVLPTLDPISRAYGETMLAHPAMKEWYAAAEKEPWVIPAYETQTLA